MVNNNAKNMFILPCISVYVLYTYTTSVCSTMLITKLLHLKIGLHQFFFTLNSTSRYKILPLNINTSTTISQYCTDIWTRSAVYNLVQRNPGVMCKQQNWYLYLHFTDSAIGSFKGACIENECSMKGIAKHIFYTLTEMIKKLQQWLDKSYLQQYCHLNWSHILYIALGI